MSSEMDSYEDDYKVKRPPRFLPKESQQRKTGLFAVIFCFLLLIISYQLYPFPSRSAFNFTCSKSFTRVPELFGSFAPPHTSADCKVVDSVIPQSQSEYFSPEEVVRWDKYSLILRGKRVFLWSGEFHTWRLPVPDLWKDILEKIKAAGLNAISIYVHWGLSNPSPGVLDFDGFRSLQPLFDFARETGLFIVVRPGPYINAETTAGGIAHWATSEVASHLRTNASDYRAAWEPYIVAVCKLVQGNQITEGGPVIAVQVDNEYLQREEFGWEGKAEMMVQIEEVFKANGINVPLTFNDAYEGDNFATGKGAVDIYGFDSYPQSFDCSRPEFWYPVVTNYYDYHISVNPDEPLYIPEFQGGAFSAWGPNSPAYNTCLILTGAEFESVFYKNLWANNVKMVNFYMIYGGTSWGHLPFPGVYTSYDYGAAISENRVIGSKYTELKRQGLFLRSAPDFYKTDIVGNSTDGTVSITNPDVFVTYLKNPDSGAGFYIARQSNSTSVTTVDFGIVANTSIGALQVPSSTSGITLTGRESKVILTDFKFGQSGHVLFSTASVLFAGRLADRDVLFLYGDISQQHEAVISFGSGSRAKSRASHNVTFSDSIEGYTLVTFLPATEGLVFVDESPSQLVLFADAETAGTFWAPVLPNPSQTFRNYWSFGSNETILVGGPYLVRSAEIIGSELALRGDINGSTILTIIGAPKSVRSISWNGFGIDPDPRISDGDAFVTTVKSRTSSFALPHLEGWKYMDSLPEVKEGYDDSSWVTADHITTKIPYKPYYGDGPILYGCDYGFCEGIVLWRGHFTANGDEEAVNLSINGGEAFAASVWINDKFISTTYGNSSNNKNIITETNGTFVFPSGSIKPGEDNVITVLQDNMGLDETRNWDADTSKSPRGIRGYELVGGDSKFTIWMVQGKVGGYVNYPDKVRGIFNEGGLFGERVGWHLPGFDTSSWTAREFSSGLPNGDAGVGFFATDFDLDVPEGFDVPISFNFESAHQLYRALLFVNGWMMGKRVANLGPQSKFPVQEGILNYNGKNTVVVALWAMDSEPLTPTLELTADGSFEGGIGKIGFTNPGWANRE